MNMHDAFLNDHVQLCIRIYIMYEYDCMCAMCNMIYDWKCMNAMYEHMMNEKINMIKHVMMYIRCMGNEIVLLEYVC